MLDQFIEK